MDMNRKKLTEISLAFIFLILNCFMVRGQVENKKFEKFENAPDLRFWLQ